MGKKLKRIRRRLWAEAHPSDLQARASLLAGLKAMDENPKLDKKGKKRALVLAALRLIDYRNGWDEYSRPDSPWGCAVKTVH